MILKLPDRMEEILLTASKEGVREVDIAKELGITKQAISKALREGRLRLTEIFVTLAEVLNADIVRVNVRKGFAILRSRQLGRKLYVIYVPKKGPRVIIEGDIDCSTNPIVCKEVISAATMWGLIERPKNTEQPNDVITKVLSKLEE